MKTTFKLMRIAGLVAVFLVNLQSISGQEGKKPPFPGEKKEKIKAHKIAYITDRLQLTSQEAEKFWPVYNENEAAMENFHKEFRKNHPFEPEDIENLSDTEADKFLNDQQQHELKALGMRSEFIGKLHQVISPKKILILLEAEKDFKVELMRKASGMREPPPPPPREE
jgi:hypothetical protein